MINEHITNSSFLHYFTEVLKQYGSRLSDYEKQEIEKYPEVWYVGLESVKINAKPGTPLNCGYDDENGSYNKVNLICLKMNVIADLTIIFFKKKT